MISFINKAYTLSVADYFSNRLACPEVSKNGILITFPFFVGPERAGQEKKSDPHVFSCGRTVLSVPQWEEESSLRRNRLFMIQV